MTESLNPYNVRMYRRRGALSIGLGIAGMIISAAALLDPGLLTTSSAAQKLKGPVDEIWLTAYFFGSLAAVAGVTWRPIPRPATEAVGLWFLIFAMLVNGVAIIANRGIIGGGITAVPLFAIAWVLSQRIRDLHEAAKIDRRVVDVGRPSGDRRVGSI